jgi:hypothetical protein
LLGRRKSLANEKWSSSLPFPLSDGRREWRSGDADDRKLEAVAVQIALPVIAPPSEPLEPCDDETDIPEVESDDSDGQRDSLISGKVGVMASRPAKTLDVT